MAISIIHGNKQDQPFCPLWKRKLEFIQREKEHTTRCDVWKFLAWMSIFLSGQPLHKLLVSTIITYSRIYLPRRTKCLVPMWCTVCDALSCLMCVSIPHTSRFPRTYCCSRSVMMYNSYRTLNSHVTVELTCHCCRWDKFSTYGRPGEARDHTYLSNFK